MLERRPLLAWARASWTMYSLHLNTTTSSSWVAPLQYCRHRSIGPNQHVQQQHKTNYIVLWDPPKTAAMMAIAVNKTIFNPLINLHMIAVKGAMTPIGVNKFGCDIIVRPMVMQVLKMLAHCGPTRKLRQFQLGWSSKIDKVWPICSILTKWMVNHVNYNLRKAM